MNETNFLMDGRIGTMPLRDFQKDTYWQRFIVIHGLFKNSKCIVVCCLMVIMFGWILMPTQHYAGPPNFANRIRL